MVGRGLGPARAGGVQGAQVTHHRHGGLVLVVQLAEQCRGGLGVGDGGREPGPAGLQRRPDPGESGLECRVGAGIRAGGGELLGAGGHVGLEHVAGRPAERVQPRGRRRRQPIDLDLDPPQLRAQVVDPGLGRGELVGGDGVDGAGGPGVLDPAADGAGITVLEALRELGRHVVETALTQVEEVGASVEHGLTQRQAPRSQVAGRGQVEVGGVQHGDAVVGGGEEQLELGDPTGTCGMLTDQRLEVVALGLTRRHQVFGLGPRGRELAQARRQCEPAVRARGGRLVVPHELGHGRVEVVHAGAAGRPPRGRASRRAGSGPRTLGCARPQLRAASTSASARSWAAR